MNNVPIALGKEPSTLPVSGIIDANQSPVCISKDHATDRPAPEQSNRRRLIETANLVARQRHVDQGQSGSTDLHQKETLAGARDGDYCDVSSAHRSNGHCCLCGSSLKFGFARGGEFCPSVQPRSDEARAEGQCGAAQDSYASCWQGCDTSGSPACNPWRRQSCHSAKNDCNTAVRRGRYTTQDGCYPAREAHRHTRHRQRRAQGCGSAHRTTTNPQSPRQPGAAEQGDAAEPRTIQARQCSAQSGAQGRQSRMDAPAPGLLLQAR